MTQLSLGWLEEMTGASPATHAPSARARRRDPETSHAAAIRSLEFSRKHASAIYCWLVDHPAGGNFHEIGKGTGIDAIAVARPLERTLPDGWRV